MATIPENSFVAFYTKYELNICTTAFHWVEDRLVVMSLTVIGPGDVGSLQWETPDSVASWRIVGDTWMSLGDDPAAMLDQLSALDIGRANSPTQLDRTDRLPPRSTALAMTASAVSAPPTAAGTHKAAWSPRPAGRRAAAWPLLTPPTGARNPVTGPATPSLAWARRAC